MKMSDTSSKIAHLARQSGGWNTFKDRYLTMTAPPLGVDTADCIRQWKKEKVAARYGFFFTFADIERAQKQEAEIARAAKRRNRHLKPAASD